MNKKGDFGSIIFVIVFLFAIGIALFFINHINDEIYSKLGTELVEYNDTEGYNVISDIQSFDNSVWDYAFVGIFIGMIMALGLMAYAVRISPVFYWIYGLMSLTVLAAGVVLSNIWQKLSVDPEFTNTIARFPMMDAILGSYYPMIITAIIFIGMIVLFGKPPGQQEGII